VKDWIKNFKSKLPVPAGKKTPPAKTQLSLSGQTCKNCHSPLYGLYCSVCGQRHFTGKNPYWEFLEDMTDQMISPESKLWRTFFHLLILPGLMTRNYFKGRRASYAPPIRLYLISLVAFFAALAILDVAVFKLSMVATESVFLEEEKQEALNDIEGRIASAREQDREPRLIEILEGVQEEIRVRPVTGATSFLAVEGSSFKYLPKLEMFAPLGDDLENEVDAKAINDFFEIAQPVQDAGFFSDFLRRVQNGFVRAAEDPRKLNNSLNIWLPRVMIIFVPMFGIFLRFFFWDKKHFVLNQMVFSLHFHTALFFFLTFFLVAQAIFGEWAQNAGLVLSAWGFPIFMFFSLKNSYENGWLKATGKFVVISIFYAFGVSIMLAGVFLVGLAEV